MVKFTDNQIVFFRILEVILLIAVIITVAIFIRYAVGPGSKCLSNPLVYGAKTLSKANNAEFSCTCSINTEGVNTLIYVDSQGWRQESQRIDLMGGKDIAQNHFDNWISKQNWSEDA